MTDVLRGGPDLPQIFVGPFEVLLPDGPLPRATLDSSVHYIGAHGWQAVVRQDVHVGLCALVENL